MSVKSTPLNDASVCISCGVPATVRGLDKAHVQSRARRPDLKEAADNQVLMCRRCHDAMDREHKFRLVIEDGFCVKQEWSNEVADFADVRRVRVVVDKKRGHLVEAPVLSAAAEGSAVNDPARGTSLHPAGTSASPSAAAPSAEALSDGVEAVIPTTDAPTSVSASSPSTKEEMPQQTWGGKTNRFARWEDSDGADIPTAETSEMHERETAQVGGAVLGHGRSTDADNDGGGSSLQDVQPDTDTGRIPGLTHEQRVAKAKEIHDTEWNRQWIAGDTGNQWIAELGESAEQYLSDFGYVHESLANILRVCAAIPKSMRRAGLRFSHHVVVADLNREDMEMWLDQAETDGWSVAEFRRQVKGTKPRVKRWSREELDGYVDGYPDYEVRPLLRNWLAYVEAQG